MKIHLDTDIGGDVDDICSLAYLLRLPDVELVGLTTTAEENGRRAGYARHVLDLAGLPEIPVRAGANVSDHNYRYNTLSYQDDVKNWGVIIPPRPNPIDDALDLLKQSIDEGAKIIAIGPYTNLRLVDERYPGVLAKADVVVMGGHVYDIPVGYPKWGNTDDWNIQLDVTSAKYLFDRTTPMMTSLTVTVQTYLRRSQLSRLDAGDALAQLLAKQIRYFAEYEGYEAMYGETCDKLPDDFINFQHDPLACAVAVGYRDGIAIQTLNLAFSIEDGYLHERIATDGKAIQVVTGVDGTVFANHWLDVVVS